MSTWGFSSLWLASYRDLCLLLSRWSRLGHLSGIQWRLPRCWAESSHFILEEQSKSPPSFQGKAILQVYDHTLESKLNHYPTHKENTQTWTCQAQHLSHLTQSREWVACHHPRTRSHKATHRVDYHVPVSSFYWRPFPYQQVRLRWTAQFCFS